MSSEDVKPKIKNKKDYLKKYLSGKDKKKKDHKVSLHTARHVKIIDDDAYTDDVDTTFNEDLFFAGEDAPMIVNEIIEDPVNNGTNNKWRSISEVQRSDDLNSAGDSNELKTANSTDKGYLKHSKVSKTLDGKNAGLQSATSLKKEIASRKRSENAKFDEMDPEISGRNAEIRIRSTGRKRNRTRHDSDDEIEQRKRNEQIEEKTKVIYEKWGKGLKQIEDHRNKLADFEHEKAKPLARYENDEDLETHLKQQERAGDPMLEYMRQKKKSNDENRNIPQKPLYDGPFPENRFGIRPGYRWDGVDRSNGYEQKWFNVQNERRYIQDEAYKYSVEDM